MKKRSLVLSLTLIGAFACEHPLGVDSPLGPRPYFAVTSTEDYRVIELGRFTEGGIATARDLNDVGQVVGHSNLLTAWPWNTRAFLWEDGVLTNLGPLGGTDSQAWAVNDRGQIAGYTYDGGPTTAWLWEDGEVTYLPPLAGGRSFAFGINEAGHVVGSTTYGNGSSQHAFVWRDGVMTDLGGLCATCGSRAYDINNAGLIVGYGFSTEGTRAVVWEDGVIRDIGVLPGGDAAEAWGVNDLGQVVGASNVQPRSGNRHAFLWEDGVMIDLGTPPEAFRSWAFDINNAGQVAADLGYVWAEGVWTRLPGGSGRAFAINERGELAGQGGASGGPVLWTTNRPPTADAGSDQSVTRGSSAGAVVTLDASASSDSDGEIVLYEWLEGGELVAEGVSATVTLALGSHTLTLRVTDDFGDEAEDDAVIDVLNAVPVADAGADPTVLVTLHVAFDGSGSSDVDGVLIFSWDLGDGTVVSGPNVDHAYAVAGLYAATLTVTDNDGASASDGVTVTVLTPSQGTIVLVGDLDELVVQGTLDPEDAVGPRRKLIDTLNHLDGGRARPAANKLRDFILQIEALVNSGRIDPPAAADLIGDAEDLIQVIEG